MGKIYKVFLLIALLTVLMSFRVFALDFEGLPTGISGGVISDGNDVIKMGETDNGTVYVISGTISATQTTDSGDNSVCNINYSAIKLFGYNKITNSIAYNISYDTSYSETSGIAASGSNNYIYIPRFEGDPFGTYTYGFVRVNLDTGLVDKTLISAPTVPSGYTGKHLAVSNTETVYLLAKETTTGNNNIFKWNGSAFVSATTAAFPSPYNTRDTHAFCVPSDNTCYTSFGRLVYKTNLTANTCTQIFNAGSTTNNEYYGIELLPGIDTDDVVYALCNRYFSDSRYGRVYYYDASANSFKNTIGDNNNNFNYKNYSITRAPNSSKISLCYWGSSLKMILIDNLGKVSTVYGSTGTKQEMIYYWDDSGDHKLSFVYSVIGGFGATTGGSWVITKKEIDRYSWPDHYYTTLYIKLTPLLPPEWSQLASTATQNKTFSKLKVMASGTFEEIVDGEFGSSTGISADVKDKTGTVVGNIKATTTTGDGYTVVSGSVTTPGIYNVTVNGQKLVFKTIKSPTINSVATITFN